MGARAALRPSAEAGSALGRYRGEGTLVGGGRIRYGTVPWAKGRNTLSRAEPLQPEPKPSRHKQRPRRTAGPGRPPLGNAPTGEAYAECGHLEETNEKRASFECETYPTFSYFDFGAPQIGHLSGGTPNSMSPQTGQR